MENKIIFENEELARGIFKIAETSIEISGNSEDNFITSLKCSGYIRKSAVEEAEESYYRYVSCARGMCDKEDGQYILIEKLWNGFQELKLEIQRLSNK